MFTPCFLQESLWNGFYIPIESAPSWIRLVTIELNKLGLTRQLSMKSSFGAEILWPGMLFPNSCGYQSCGETQACLYTSDQPIFFLDFFANQISLASCHFMIPWEQTLSHVSELCMQSYTESTGSILSCYCAKSDKIMWGHCAQQGIILRACDLLIYQRSCSSSLVVIFRSRSIFQRLP